MQTALVIITFTLAVGYILRKFVWLPLFETPKKTIGTLDGARTKCGKDDCACH